MLGALCAKVDGKTKPRGALGQLETLALKVGLIQQTLEPQLTRPVILVFAGDHGIVADGVSAFPQEVTYQMVLNFLRGGAAINVFSRQNGILLRVVDAGVKGEFPVQDGLINAKVGSGTASFLRGPAMTHEQCTAAIGRGRELAAAEMDAGSNVLGFGEMGIGNTTSAAALMSVLCDLPPAECVGRGTGLDDAGLQRKQVVVEQALAYHGRHVADPLSALMTFGGFEIAMMTGAMLEAAERRALLLIDGFIATTALLVAARLQPTILEYCVFAHRSGEAGHARLLAEFDAQPLLDLGMRLGEGTGAAMAYPIVQAAVNFLNEMASFESAGVSARAG
ncbi:nicotinate-nucleotide--dimethylbenzimidazole phosphoribosyltransferase [mine drainage metagenome]|uniref:Nicotinate-nucleotide--dimethylbenzimidazole phosphoribosyltransferase n=1 Tax=mine drainage metagenome TaxID=410659 RepID=A0A1J5RFD1_9ZZZZ